MYCSLCSLIFDKYCEQSPSDHLCLSQLPAPNSVALDMSLQTTLDVKVKKEAPVEVDSSPPDSPESISGNSDHSREPPVKGKVGQKWEGVGGGIAWLYREEGGTLTDVERDWLMVSLCLLQYYMKTPWVEEVNNLSFSDMLKPFCVYSE